MADIPQNVLDAISKAQDSKAQAETADTDVQNTTNSVTAAQTALVTAQSKSVDLHKTALDDAHTAIAALTGLLGVP